MFRSIMTVCLVAGILATLQPSAGAVSVSDPNDPLTRLDIRSASVVQLTEKKLAVRLVFWGRTPMWLLRRHAARIEMSYEVPKNAHEELGFRFWPNRRGQLRITWGEPASACCERHGAQHPDPFTYLAVVPFSMDGFIPPIRSFRAARTARLPVCWHAICGVAGGRIIDRTAWVRT